MSAPWPPPSRPEQPWDGISAADWQALADLFARLDQVSDELAAAERARRGRFWLGW
jgi:hypothetical protein